MKVQITENLDIEFPSRRWRCHHCEHDLGPAAENYKRGCLIADRSPDEIWAPRIDEPVTFSYNPEWVRVIEFVCPGCGWLIEVELLPPGHPITHDIELDLDRLESQVASAGVAAVTDAGTTEGNDR